MKCFIDLGAYTGDTLDLALKLYNNFDKFYAFEPYKKSFDLLSERFKDDKRLVFVKAAADVSSGKRKLYLHKELTTRPSAALGNSLIETKANVDITNFEDVQIIDFCEFLENRFDPKDTIVLKIDIEGSEYDLFESMIKRGSFRYINDIYSEWHYDKNNIKETERHWNVVRSLQSLGYSIRGSNQHDEFSKMFKGYSVSAKAKLWCRNLMNSIRRKKV